MKPVGTGSYGKVYKSEENVLKISTGSSYKIFLRELVILRYLNIRRFKYSPKLNAFDVDKMIIKMDYLPMTFNKYISTNHDTKERALYLMSLCKAVGALHQLGIVHADLKLSNVMLSSNSVSLIDFGLSGPPNYALCEYTTKAYEDPSKNKGPESDVYSLGIVFLEVLSGSRFTDIPKKSDIKYRLSLIDPIYSGLVKKMLDRSPRKRPSMDYIISFFNQEPEQVESINYCLDIKPIKNGTFNWIKSVMDIRNISGPFDPVIITILACSMTPDKSYKYVQVYSVGLLIIYSSIYNGDISLEKGVSLCPGSISREERKKLLVDALNNLISNDSLILTLIAGRVISC